MISEDQWQQLKLSELLGMFRQVNDRIKIIKDDLLRINDYLNNFDKRLALVEQALVRNRERLLDINDKGEILE